MYIYLFMFLQFITITIIHIIIVFIYIHCLYHIPAINIHQIWILIYKKYITKLINITIDIKI